MPCSITEDNWWRFYALFSYLWLQGSVNVHRGALLLVPQWQCISSCVFYILSQLFPLPCGDGSTVPRKVSDSSVIMPFSGVLWLLHFLYSVGSHPVSSLHIYTFVVSRAFMAGGASITEDADFSRAPGLTSGLKGSVNVHRGALLLVPQWQCISSSVFYIVYKYVRNVILIANFLWIRKGH